MYTVRIVLDVCVPSKVAEQGPDAVEEYLNDKLATDPEFYGYIDQGCFTIADEPEPDYPFSEE